jgi:hypothetical protein
MRSLKVISSKIILVLLFIGLTSCSSAKVLVKNPKTSEAKECAGDPWASFTPNLDAKKCAELYKK